MARCSGDLEVNFYNLKKPDVRTKTHFYILASLLGEHVTWSWRSGWTVGTGHGWLESWSKSERSSCVIVVIVVVSQAVPSPRPQVVMGKEALLLKMGTEKKNSLLYHETEMLFKLILGNTFSLPCCVCILRMCCTALTYTLPC